jgi:hypothetical protein
MEVEGRVDGQANPSGVYSEIAQPRQAPPEQPLLLCLFRQPLTHREMRGRGNTAL